MASSQTQTLRRDEAFEATANLAGLRAAAACAGANGYVSKQEIGESLLVAVRTVLEGKPYLSAEVSKAREDS